MREESTAARGILALSIAGILSKVISVLYTPMLRSILGIEGYGVYGKVLEVFLFVYAITSAGAQPAVAKVVSELTAVGNVKGSVMALKISRKFYFWCGTIAGLLMMVLAFPISNIIGGSAAYGIIALGPCVLITSLLSVQRGFLQGKNNMTPIAVSQVLEQFLNVIISLLFAFILGSVSLSLGVAGAQVGTSIGAIFACFFVIYKYFQNGYALEASEDTEHRVNSKKIFSRIVMYSIPIVMSSGLQNFGGLVDMLNVSTRLISSGLTEKVANSLYGEYTTYKTLYGVPLVMITAIGTTVLPAISRARALHDMKGIRRNIRRTFKLSLLIAIPSAVGLSILSEHIYMCLFNDTIGARMMELGSFILVLMTITQIQSVILQGINKFYYILLTFLIGIIFKIILNYIFVGMIDINIYGVLIGNCFWHLIPAVLNHRKICKTMKMRMSFIRLIFKPLFASTVMGLALILLEKPVDFMYKFIGPSRLTDVPITIVSVGIGVFIYAYLMILMGGIRKDDIETVSPKVMRLIPRFMRMKLR